MDSYIYIYVHVINMMMETAEDSKNTFNIMRQTSKNELMWTLQ